MSDLHSRSVPVYWADFTLTTAAAWGFAVLYFLAPPWGPTQIGAYLASIVLVFRTGTFIHELVHTRRGQMVYAKRFPPRDETHLAIVEGLAFAYLTGLAVHSRR